MWLKKVNLIINVVKKYALLYLYTKYLSICNVDLNADLWNYQKNLIRDDAFTEPDKSLRDYELIV